MRYSSLICSIFAADALVFSSNVPYSQTFEDNYNVLKYTANHGPYSNRRSFGVSRDPPDGCEIEQVVLIMRHGERYPSKGSMKNIEKSVGKLMSKKGSLTGSLEFLNNWKLYSNSESGWIEAESTTGAYSGLHDAHTAGTLYANRYGYLWDKDEIIPVFTSGYARVIDTAREFMRGFFGYNLTQAALNIIPETPDQGANTLVPQCLNTSIGKPATCSNNWDYPPFHQLAKKWNSEYGVSLEWRDIFNIALMTIYELNVVGSSPWVSAIPSDVWVATEHYLSSQFYCQSGPGSPEAIARGTNFFNASRTLLMQGPENGMPLSLNFAHDGDIAELHAATGLEPALGFNDSYIQLHPGYHAADIIPMGGRVIFERMRCSNSDFNATWTEKYPLSVNMTDAIDSVNSTKGSDVYVRIIFNEAVVPIEKCQSGPGLSCPLQDYSNYVDSQISGRLFADVCNLTDNAPKHLSFWWNYNTTTNLNKMNDTLGFQAKGTNYLGQAIGS